MKVGIITFHDAYSFGATLQCYALQKYLKNEKYDAEIIDYSMNAYLELRKKKKALFWIKKAFRILRHPVKRYRLQINEKQKREKQQDYQKELAVRNKKFQDFWKEEYTTNGVRYTAYSQIRQNCPQYDAYICGSDQIWNPNFCDMDDTYYLEFAPAERRIAYAPSLGVSNLTSEQGRVIRERIMGIPFLSVRERKAGEIIQGLSGRNCQLVTDPTFLLCRADWEMIASKSQTEIKDRYILTYFIGDDDYSKRYMEEAKARFREYRIINLVFDYCDYGPADFVKLIMNAEFVVTNSFHGIAFCINLNVPFAIGKTMKDYRTDSGFSRMDFLLEKLDLKARILTEEMGLKDISVEIDFFVVNQKLSEWRADSKAYLKGALQQVEKGE